MGKSITPKYRLEVDGKPFLWNCGIGTNNESLEKWIYKFGKSFEIGGVNEHVSRFLDYIPYPSEAKVIVQKTGQVVAYWKAGLFQVW